MHIARVVDAFITYRNAGLTLGVLEDQTNWKRIAKNGFLNLQLTVGDAIVVSIRVLAFDLLTSSLVDLS